MKETLKDRTELLNLKCSERGCKKKSVGIFKTKPYCQDHYDDINPRIKRFRYPNGSVY